MDFTKRLSLFLVPERQFTHLLLYIFAHLSSIPAATTGKTLTSSPSPANSGGMRACTNAPAASRIANTLHKTPAKVESDPVNRFPTDGDGDENAGQAWTHEDYICGGFGNVGAAVHVHADGGLRKSNSVISPIAAEHNDGLISFLF